ncbi:zinc finger E-box-binding homeobox 1-like isoform X2 [Corythoichthys intestinalis]|uniref:zinc finger E-box-binding homeobox 1-like isoform X2 n=1 Tax=Corythoichthys intestinalis TaxID=161448 RepID=UPI0025A5C266|nr:zinc finger E-box-binding homeobox 1-like isoform X2 [Corythoichthys intestinalis]
MADGPRCKRRKQANPKRSSVTSSNGGLEASSSDSDDDDKLHIVEDESPPDAESVVARGGLRRRRCAKDAVEAVLTHNGDWNGVKEEFASGEEEDAGEEEGGVKIEEEILQKEDMTVIYPEAPDDEHSPAETGGADENGTPDTLQLHTCPYCSRGYKRNASLKEHIKYRHETSEDNYRCSHCSYTFTYRSQLERHMSHHRGNKDQRHVQATGGGGSGGGARKFKCTECFKAFKYKHHLKEHLRIHSGEKPYECANCKKRFSHSGSYSSHISSKKCMSAVTTPNGLARKPVKSPPPVTEISRVAISSGRTVLKEKLESKPLQEQLPITQIKSEPNGQPCKPAVATEPAANGAAPQPPPQGVAMVLPTVGLAPPININLSELQNVLKVALDGNVLRQVLGTTDGAAVQGKPGIVVQQPQQQIISLPAFVDHDGTTKIIINYSIGPAPATTATSTATTTTGVPMPLFVKNNLVPAAPIPTKTDKPSTPKVDLSLVKEEPEDSVLITDTKTDPAMSIKTEDRTEVLPPNSGSGTCSLCDECPENLEALHLLQHHKVANGEAVDSAALDPSFAALLSDAGVTLQQEPAVDDLLTLLKTYFASNSNPDQAEFEKISDSVGIPVAVVQKWFAKMNSGRQSCQETATSKQTESLNTEDDTKQALCSSPSDSPSLNANDLIIVKREPDDPEVLDSQAEPLDLSLPKQLAAPASTVTPEDTPPPPKPPQPMNLTYLRKEQVDSRTVFVAAPQTRRTTVSIMPTSQLPTLVAITGQGSVGCLGTLGDSAKRTILIPQLTYTYAGAAGGAAKTVVLNGHKTSDAASEGATDERKEISVMKKPRLENGVYACDLCNKAFQKGSSLLRHKYEHTGKRPHECPVCKKAFKHKHHLIEHSRLHSGEKPYRCNKCGKRFSHSGSYSQHMNHRYSYCKPDGSDPDSSPDADAAEVAAAVVAGSPDATLDSDIGESEEDDEAMCVDDIRVVQVDDGECEIYEGNFDEDEEDENEDGGEEEERKEENEKNLDVDEFACQVVEVELNHDQTQESAVEGQDGGKVDKAEAAGINLDQMADCAYKSIRDWSDSEESSDDQAVTDAK